MPKTLGLLLSICSFISILFGAFFFLDNRYAKAFETSEMKEQTIKIEKRLENKIIMDRIDSLQERIWKYQDRYGEKLEKTHDSLVIDEFKRLSTEKETLEKSLNKEK